MVKEDNKILYDNYNQDKSTRNIINNYYKKEKLILGEITKINDLYKVIPLKNTKCFMKNACHKDMQYPMYVDILENKMCVKCRCVECWNKIYPCEHIILNNNELKIIINGDINVINNYGNDNIIDSTFEMQNIIKDVELNKLIFTSLNMFSEQSIVDILYYLYEDEFMFAEDENWYKYNYTLHKWETYRKNGSFVRTAISETMKKYYNLIKDNYKNIDQNQLKYIKNLLTKSIGVMKFRINCCSMLGDHIMANNPRSKHFAKNLDSNKHLIGFTNGVYDIQKDIFRNGEPSDLISMNTNYNFISNYTEKIGRAHV